MVNKKNFANAYCIELLTDDQAGFDVCLAIAALELPLVVIVRRLTAQIMSLSDFELAQIYERVILSEDEYMRLKKSCEFYLRF